MFSADAPGLPLLGIRTRLRGLVRYPLFVRGLAAASFVSGVPHVTMSTPGERTVFDHRMNVDRCGSFTELMRTPDRGQVSMLHSSMSMSLWYYKSESIVRHVGVSQWRGASRTSELRWPMCQVGCDSVCASFPACTYFEVPIYERHHTCRRTRYAA